MPSSLQEAMNKVLGTVASVTNPGTPYDPFAKGEAEIAALRAQTDQLSKSMGIQPASTTPAQPASTTPAMSSPWGQISGTNADQYRQYLAKQHPAVLPATYQQMVANAPNPFTGSVRNSQAGGNYPGSGSWQQKAQYWKDLAAKT
jgi:hypothetical protein